MLPRLLSLTAVVLCGLAPAADEEKSAAPEFTKVTKWLNGKAVKMADLKDKVVVVHFWTHGCVNCVNNYPHYRAWQDRYKDNKDVVIVGIHTPEFEREKDVERIQAQAERHKLTFAIAVDNDQANWRAWGNRYWPCVYLVDKAGKVQARWEGELGEKGYKAMTAKLDELLVAKK